MTSKACLSTSMSAGRPKSDGVQPDAAVGLTGTRPTTRLYVPSSAAVTAINTSDRLSPPRSSPKDAKRAFPSDARTVGIRAKRSRHRSPRGYSSSVRAWLTQHNSPGMTPLSVTDAFSRSPLSRASCPFIGPILKGSEGSIPAVYFANSRARHRPPSAIVPSLIRRRDGSTDVATKRMILRSVGSPVLEPSTQEALLACAYDSRKGLREALRSGTAPSRARTSAEWA